MSGHPAHCTVLGGGLAGLAAARAAREHGLTCILYEATGRLGGNAITLEHDGFRFDAGAHRFHDQIPEVTRRVESLLGADLHRVDAPSRICVDSAFVDFPLAPLDLLRKLPGPMLMRAAVDVAGVKLRRRRACANLEEYAVDAYGETLARTFLTNYSEKLWGLPSRLLSTAAAGKRLKGLSWKTFLLDAFRGAQARTAHLDGHFFYPRGGIGRIADALAAHCAPNALQTRTPVTAIRCHGDRVASIELSGPDGAREERVERVICTLPLDTVLELLDPPPPARIGAAASALCYRHVVVVALLLKRDGLSQYATTYFPNASFPFTRLHEPRCRCPEMAPPGLTSLVAEIPCGPGSELWGLDDAALVSPVREGVARLGWVEAGDVLGAVVHRMPKAYPIPSVGSEEKVAEILDWMERFTNLAILGRVAGFEYHHIHDLFAQAERTVRETVSTAPAKGSRP